MKNVSHKNAPGAISAIALEVKPVRPNDGLVVGFSWFDDMSCSFGFVGSRVQRKRTAMSAARPTTGAENKKSLRPEFRSKTFVVFPQSGTPLCRAPFYSETGDGCKYIFVLNLV